MTSPLQAVAEHARSVYGSHAAAARALGYSRQAWHAMRKRHDAYWHTVAGLLVNLAALGHPLRVTLTADGVTVEPLEER